MRDRFAGVVASKFFPRHGIELVGAFVAPTEDGRLTYVTRFESEEARKKAWDGFAADPEWAQVKTETEEGGVLLKSQTISVLLSAISGLVLD